MALDFGTIAQSYRINYGTLNSWQPTTASFAMWVYPTNPTGAQDQLILSKRSAGGGWFADISGWGDPELLFYLDRATIDLQVQSTGNIIVADTWQFVAGVMDTSGANGDQKLWHATLTSAPAEPAYGSQVVGSGAGVDVSSEVVISGANRAADSGWGNYAGRIGPTMVWDTVLTEAEITSVWLDSRPCVSIPGLRLYAFPGLHGASTVPDLSSNGNNGTITNATLADSAPLPAPFPPAIGLPHGPWISASETITIAKMALTTTGKSIQANKAITAERSALTWTGRGVNTNMSEALLPLKMAITWTGKQPSVNETVKVSKSSLTWTGRSLYINQVELIAKAVLTWTGRTIDAYISETITLSKMALTWTGRAAYPNQAVRLSKMALTWTGRTVTTVGSEVIVPVKMVLTWTGKLPLVNETITVAKATVTSTGKLVYTGQTLVVAKAALTWTGKTVTTLVGEVVAIAKMSLTWTGKILYVDKTITIAKMTLTWTGRSLRVVGLSVGRGLMKFGSLLKLN